MQLGGSSARYDVKLGYKGFVTYVEAHVPVPVPPGSAEQAVLVRCAGGVSRELGESEERAADAFVGMLVERFRGRVDDKEELMAKVLDQKEMGSLRHEWSTCTTFEVEDFSTWLWE